MSTVAEVQLWGRTVGAVALADGAAVASFEYDSAFIRSTIEIAPLTMPLSSRIFSMLSNGCYRLEPGHRRGSVGPGEG